MIKIDLTSAEKRKPIMGFGTSACWWSQNVADKSTADGLAELLYGKNGLGLNIYRFNIGAGWDNDNCRVENPWRRCESFYVDENTDESENFCGRYDFEKDKNSYTFLKRCLKEGTIDTVILFANSPHYSLTSSGQASGSLMHHTCNLPMSNYGRFADIFLDITQHFIDDGVPVNYISPINEPQWKWGGKSVWQEGCHYEPKEVAAVFHTFAQKLEERNMSVKLYGPESGEIAGLTEEYLKLFLQDDLIMKHLGAFALHSYHADRNFEIRKNFYKNTVFTHPEIRFDMSEWCELPCKSGTKSINGALNTARVIGRDLTLLGARSWTSWVAVNQYADKKGDGIDYSDGLLAATDGFSQYSIRKRYYAMLHFTRFLPKLSAALITGVESGEKLNVFAFETPGGDYIIVAENEGGATDIEIKCGKENTEIYTTTQKRNFCREKETAFCGKLHLKAKSLTTARLYNGE